MVEGDFKGRNLKGVRVNCLNKEKFEIEKGLLSCGDETHPSMIVETFPKEEFKGSEPLNVHPLAVVEEQGVPYLMSSD